MSQKNPTPKAIAFKNSSDAKEAMMVVKGADPDSDLFGKLDERGGDGQQIYIGKTAEGIKAIDKIAAILARHNQACVDEGQRNFFIQHSVTLEWVNPEASDLVVNDDGSVEKTIATAPDKFFPFKKKGNYKDGQRVDGFHFGVPQASVLRVILTEDDELTITERPWQCKPADPKTNMAEGSTWDRLVAKEKEVVNVFTSLDEAAKRIFHCAATDKRASFLAATVEELRSRQRIAKRIRQQTTTLGDRLSGSSRQALESAVGAGIEA